MTTSRAARGAGFAAARITQPLRDTIRERAPAVAAG